jgi:hypothetical protein
MATILPGEVTFHARFLPASSSPFLQSAASAACERFRCFALDLVDSSMNTDRSIAPADTRPAAPKRTWVSPVVLDMGAMRELTLLQGVSEICC